MFEEERHIERESDRINHLIYRWEKIRKRLIIVSESMQPMRNEETRNWKLPLFSSSLIFYSVNTMLLMNSFFFSDLNAMRWRRSNEWKSEGEKKRKRKNNDWDCASVWKDHERRWEDTTRVFSFSLRFCVQLTERKREREKKDDEHQE